MRKPWQTKEWKEKRALFLIGKVCEWCGSTENLSISHKEMDDRPQITYQVFGEFLSNYLNDEKNKEEIKELQRKAWIGITPEYLDVCPVCKKSCYRRSDKYCKENGVPKFRCSPCRSEFEEPSKKMKLSSINYLRKRFYLEIKNKYGAEITNISSEKIQKSDERYNSFENVMVQCNRCHFAYHKGMNLCPKCKTKYKNTRYETCWNCKPKVENKILEKKEKILYIHPWCNLNIYIGNEDWEFESSTTLVCIEYCPNKEISYDINNCEIAKKKTNEGEQ